MTANAEQLALIEILAAEINSTSQASRMTKLSQPFSFRWMVDKTCVYGLQAVISVGSNHELKISDLLCRVEMWGPFFCVKQADIREGAGINVWYVVIW